MERPVTRFVIYGAGAIGATLGAALQTSGHDVVLIARGAHYEALARNGLVFETAVATNTLQIPVVDHPSRIAFNEGDAVVLAMKSQDTLTAVSSLAAVAPRSTPLICAQNGVENERVALRYFSDVHAMCVMCPATHLAPGSVVAHSYPVFGVFDVGRYPGGFDATDKSVAESLRLSHCESLARPDAPAWKYSKLLRNLGNAVDALFPRSPDNSAVSKTAREEALACFGAAGIDFVEDQTYDERHRRYVAQPARAVEPGRTGRHGGSTWQSLARATGRVESDYLNGEIVLLGRLHSIATPVNALLQELAGDVATRGDGPGTLTLAGFVERLDAAS